MKNLTIRKMVVLALLAALSVVLVAFVRFPLFPSAAFLEFDAGDIPIMIGTFALGPVAGLLMTTVVSLIQGFTFSAHSGPYGIIMHIISSGTLCLVAGLIYNRNKTRKQAVLALASATLAMVAVMVAANLIITPLFMGAPREAVVGMLVPVIIPFNLLKGIITSVCTFLLYKPLSKHVFKFDKK